MYVDIDVVKTHLLILKGISHNIINSRHISVSMLRTPLSMNRTIRVTLVPAVTSLTLDDHASHSIPEI